MDGEPIEVVRAYEYEMHEAIARDQGRMVDQASEFGNLKSSNELPAPAPMEAIPDQLDERDSMGDAVSDELPDARFMGESWAVAADVGERVKTKAAAFDRETKQGDATESTRCGQLLPGHLAFGGANTKLHGFTTGQYRIVQIAFLDRNGRDARTFRFGEPLKLRVSYECLLPEVPKYSCGLAVAFNRTSDFEAVMYFNTNYAHSDGELARYFDVPFRKFIGRSGVIEAIIEPIQLRAGEYFVSLGILPNQPGMHEFYEYLHCQYEVTILPNGFDEPAVFYPNVSWSHGPVDRR
jgi:hypothetical protein